MTYFILLQILKTDRIVGLTRDHREDQSRGTIGVQEYSEIMIRKFCTIVYGRNNNKARWIHNQHRERIFFYDLLPVQYTEWTHPVFKFLIYMFLVDS